MPGWSAAGAAALAAAIMGFPLMVRAIRLAIEAVDPKLEEAAALALVDEIAREVEEIRGLPFKEEFERKIISPKEIREMVIEKAEAEMPPEPFG